MLASLKCAGPAEFLIVVLGVVAARAGAPDVPSDQSTVLDDMTERHVRMRSLLYEALMCSLAAAVGVCGLVAVWKMNGGQLVLGPFTVDVTGVHLLQGRYFRLSVRGTQLLPGVQFENHSWRWPRWRYRIGEDNGFRSVDAEEGRGGVALLEDAKVDDAMVDEQTEVDTDKVQMNALLEDAKFNEAKVDEQTELDTEKVLMNQMTLCDQQRPYMRKRRFLLTALFLAYASTSVGIPLLKRDSVSCTRGFFWEDHLLFMATGTTTKLVELYLLASDPTLTGTLDVIAFTLKFAPSFLGYADGYTDATSTAIAAACQDSPLATSLSRWMAGFYGVGVFGAQWIVFGAIACRDDSQVVLLKLLHMDALASCVTITKETRNLLFYLALTRSILEDLPQAALQTIFIVKVYDNYFLFVSVAVGIASSLKAAYDASHRAMAAYGAYIRDAAPDGEGGEEDAERDAEEARDAEAEEEDAEGERSQPGSSRVRAEAEARAAELQAKAQAAEAAARALAAEADEARAQAAEAKRRPMFGRFLPQNSKPKGEATAAELQAKAQIAEAKAQAAEAQAHARWYARAAEAEAEAKYKAKPRGQDTCGCEVVREEIRQVQSECDAYGYSGHSDHSMRDHCEECGKVHEYDVACFAGECEVCLAEGGARQLSHIVAGDRVATPSGSARVVCVVKTCTRGGSALLVDLPGGLRVTPGHPVQVGGAWRKPEELAPVRRRPCDCVFNLVLSAGHVVYVNGVPCVTLGHDLAEPGLGHSYWGTGRVIADLRRRPGWGAGLVVLGADRRCKGCESLRAALDDAGLRDEGKRAQAACSARALAAPTAWSPRLLRTLHAAALGGTGLGSELRTGPVFLTGRRHLPPDAGEVPRLVDGHLAQTQGILASAGPWVAAAYALWWVNAVHPFPDGNGRTARGLAFAILASELGVQPRTGWHAPFEGERRTAYFEGLQRADGHIGACRCCAAGRPRPDGPGGARGPLCQNALSGLVDLLHFAVEADQGMDSSQLAKKTQ